MEEELKKIKDKSFIPVILEFTVVKPTDDDTETIGDKIKLTHHGEYRSDVSLQGYNLLFLLDNTEHYYKTKIQMNGYNYVLPLDRPINIGSLGHQNDKEWQHHFVSDEAMITFCIKEKMFVNSNKWEDDEGRDIIYRLNMVGVMHQIEITYPSGKTKRINGIGDFKYRLLKGL